MPTPPQREAAYKAATLPTPAWRTAVIAHAQNLQMRMTAAERQAQRPAAARVLAALVLTLVLGSAHAADCDTSRVPK